MDQAAVETRNIHLRGSRSSWTRHKSLRSPGIVCGNNASSLMHPVAAGDAGTAEWNETSPPAPLQRLRLPGVAVMALPPLSALPCAQNRIAGAGPEWDALPSVYVCQSPNHSTTPTTSSCCRVRIYKFSLLLWFDISIIRLLPGKNPTFRLH